MHTLNKISEDIANSINKKNSSNPTFDIILAITIAKLIYDIIMCFINRNKDKESAYEDYVNAGPIERLVLRTYLNKYFKNHEDQRSELRKFLLEEKFDKDTFFKVYDEILLEKNKNG